MRHCLTCGRQYTTDFEVCPVDQTPLQADSTISDDVPLDPLVGHVLDDKYRLDQRLGVGGMGTVYRARHILIDRPVAVKVLNQRFVEDEAAQVRFRREAKAAGRLQHTNAVTVTDFGQTPDGYVYIVMELLEGRTLREVLAKEAPLETARAVALMLQVAAAVGAAHEAGIIHRDLKPANIFIVQRAELPAQVKVLDFGIAKLAAESLDDDDAKTLTQVGAMIGTPRYMSPEQCDGADLTPASDVYSLGCILYEMLTGTVPFSGSTPLAIAMKHTSDTPRSPREIVAAIPGAVEQVVLHALEKDPEDRPANASEFGRELLETAERLGFEHASLTSAPDIEALRSVGTESPSGRLVIDISRLRENRATDFSDVTVVTSPVAGTTQSEPSDATSTRPIFPRVSVSFERWKKQHVVIAAVVAAIFLAGLTIAIRSTISMRGNEPAVVASPSPTVEPTVTPTPTPIASPTPKRESPKPTPSPTPKKGSKAGSVLNKVKRIFTKPF